MDDPQARGTDMLRKLASIEGTLNIEFRCGDDWLERAQGWRED